MNTAAVLNRIRHHKVSQEPLVELLRNRDGRLCDLVRGCGTWLHLREWLESGESRLRNANFCTKFLLCRCCAARRAAKLVVAYARKVETVMASRPIPLIPAMVTLTVRNGEDLSERLQHLKDSWSRMMAAKRRGASASCRHDLIQWNKVQGSVRAIEVTRSTKGWHPHIHAFVLLSGYVCQKSLSMEWQQYTGDSFVVGVTKCRKGIVSGLIECLKYASKLTELSPEDVLAVHYAASGSRFVDPQGVLRGVPDPDIRQDDDAGLTGPYRDFFACWSKFSKSYYFRTPKDEDGPEDDDDDGEETGPDEVES
jgi:hypothetical protein